jgi:hypothetical protein
MRIESCARAAPVANAAAQAKLKMNFADFISPSDAARPAKALSLASLVP